MHWGDLGQENIKRVPPECGSALEHVYQWWMQNGRKYHKPEYCKWIFLSQVILWKIYLFPLVHVLVWPRSLYFFWGSFYSPSLTILITLFWTLLISSALKGHQLKDRESPKQKECHLAKHVSYLDAPGHSEYWMVFRIEVHTHLKAQVNTVDLLKLLKTPRHKNKWVSGTRTGPDGFPKQENVALFWQMHAWKYNNWVVIVLEEPSAVFTCLRCRKW